MSVTADGDSREDFSMRVILSCYYFYYDISRKDTNLTRFKNTWHYKITITAYLTFF